MLDEVIDLATRINLIIEARQPQIGDVWSCSPGKPKQLTDPTKFGKVSDLQSSEPIKNSIA